MQIDMLWIRTWFAKFNKQYFDGELPTPRFHIGHSRTQLGTMSYKRKSRWGRTYYFDFAIGLSNYYDQPEHRFQSVLLHEMIHLAIAHSGVKDTSPHGIVFRGMMERLNRDGWDIHVTTAAKGLEKAHTGSKTVIRQYLVLALETTNGKRFLSSVNPKYASMLNQKLPTIKEVSRFAWYTTTDQWFEDMPRVRSFRGRRVAQKTYNEKVSAMTPISLPLHH
ncbi:MAG: SprT-like domain-containing protein [Prevotella sp.]|jgi:hypothetical protein